MSVFSSSNTQYPTAQVYPANTVYVQQPAYQYQAAPEQQFNPSTMQPQPMIQPNSGVVAVNVGGQQPQPYGVQCVQIQGGKNVMNVPAACIHSIANQNFALPTRYNPNRYNDVDYSSPTIYSGAPGVDTVITLVPKPLMLYCPYCNANVVSKIKVNKCILAFYICTFAILFLCAITGGAFIYSLYLMPLGFVLMIVALIMMVVSNKKAAHLCPACSNVLGRSGEAIRLHAV